MPTSQNEFIEKVKKAHGKCHILCPIPAALRDKHILTILDEVQNAKIKTYLHLFLYAEDANTDTALQYVIDLEHNIKELSPFVTIACISGTYYLYQNPGAVLQMITTGEAARFFAASAAIRSSYKNAIFDQFIKPAVITDYRGSKNNDGFWFYGFCPKDVKILQNIFTASVFTTMLFTN